MRPFCTVQAAQTPTGTGIVVGAYLVWNLTEFEAIKNVNWPKVPVKMHLRDRFAVKICEITVLVTKLSWSFEITLLEPGASHKCTANYGFVLKIGTGRVATAPLLWFCAENRLKLDISGARISAKSNANAQFALLIQAKTTLGCQNT